MASAEKQGGGERKEEPASERTTDETLGQIGPYRLETVLGSGGMGVVYQATGPEERRVALKVLHAHLDHPSLLRRFEREARVRVDHPNVVRVLDAGAGDDGTPYIAFELLDGSSLDARAEAGDLTIGEVVDVAAQSCDGLAAAHDAGIVHRDLKPGNIFLCRDGRVKVVDFGIALLGTRETRLTATRSVVGTPAYLAPEQARRGIEIDARADIWSLGALLYDLLSGNPPFEGRTPLETIFAVLTEPVPPLWLRAPHAPTGLVEVVERALRKPRHERWPDARAMARALRVLDLGDARSLPIPRRAAEEGATPATDLQLPRGRAQMTVDHAADTASGTRSPGEVTSGEQRVVAVLVAEDVADAAMVERALVSRGGTVLPMLDRRVIGLFGGDDWEGDEAVRAVAAALGVREAARSVAVASGSLTVRKGGVAGAALREAERACAAGLAGVAVDPDTARALPGGFSVRAASNDLFEVTSERPPIGPIPPAQGGPRATTYGRDAEIAQLHQALRTVLVERRALAVLIRGPAGIGKSRLRRELERQIEASPERVTVLTGRAERKGAEASLALFGSALQGRARLGELVRGWASLSPETDAADRSEAVTSLAREAISDRTSADACAVFLGELLGVPMEGGADLTAARRDPQLMADRLRLALLDYLEGLTRKGPLALLLEEVHRADDASMDLLGDLLDRLADRPFLLLVTARPELLETRLAPLLARDVVQIQPRGLPWADVARFAADVAGRPVPEAIVHRVADHTGGNPFFVQQIIVALRERDQLDADVDRLPLPLTVEAAVQSRLDALDPAEKELCKRASLFGRPFSAGELRAFGVPEPEDLLVSLCRRDLLVGRLRAHGRGKGYHFKSALVADVAYRMMTEEARQSLHRRAAGVLALVPGADAEEIASHHEHGGEREEAAARYAAAALAASRRGDGAGVLRCSERALALGTSARDRFALHMARVDAFRFLGRRDAEVSEIREALANAKDDSERARALGEQVALLRRTGRPGEAIEVAQGAVDAARQAGDNEALTLARGRQGGALMYAGELEAARSALDEATELASSAAPHVQALVATWRAGLAGTLGDLGGRVAGYQKAVELYTQGGDVRRAANAQCNLADVYNRLGAYGEAEAALRAALEGSRRVGNRITEGYALVNLGYSLPMLGRQEQALAVLARAAAIAEATGDVRLLVTARLYTCRARLGSWPANDVAADAEQTARLAEGLSMRGLSALALSVAAQARSSLDAAAEALALSERSMALLAKLGGLEEDEAEIYLVHARILGRAGRIADAEDVLARGRMRVLEIAAGIADPEYRDRFLRDPPANRELVAAVTGR